MFRSIVTSGAVWVAAIGIGILPPNDPTPVFLPLGRLPQPVNLRVPHVRQHRGFPQRRPFRPVFR
jgi:hypothetical protein